MNKFKDKLFAIILFVVIVVASVVLYFSSGDALHPEIVAGSMQDILHTCSKALLCVAAFLTVTYLYVDAEHNRNEVRRIKNTYRPKR